jgi:outer membrane protein OmpA-like peptidoglycan-associated protein
VTKNAFVFALTCLLVFGTSLNAVAQEWQGTNIPGVSAKLAYLRQYNNILHMGILLGNSQKKRAVGPAFKYSDVVIVDSKSKRKYLPQKDADGHYIAGPIANWTGGGLWYPELEPEGLTILWADFDAIPGGGTVNIQVPLMAQISAPITMVAPTDTTVSTPLSARIDLANRKGSQLDVVVALTNTGTKMTKNLGAVVFENVYALDGVNKRRYPLLKDTSGLFLAEPKSNGTRWYPGFMRPGASSYLSLSFQAPPDTVKSVDLIVPPFAPFENVQMVGKGSAETGGISVAGSSMALQGALKDLKAEVTPELIKVNLSADFLFDFDKADVKPAAESSLQKVVTVLKNYPNSAISIDGHADGKGSEGYNQALSEKRAAAIAAWLTTHANLTAANVHTKGWGKTKPIAPNANADGSDNPAGRAKNRRVEITVKKK